MKILTIAGNLLLLLSLNVLLSAVGLFPSVGLALFPFTLLYTCISYALMQSSKGYKFNLGVNFMVLALGLLTLYIIGSNVVLMVVAFNSLGALMSLLLIPFFFLKLENRGA